MPSTFLVDKAGFIRATRNGYHDGDSLDAEVAYLLEP
jgi:hypothetical protein